MIHRPSTYTCSPATATSSAPSHVKDLPHVSPSLTKVVQGVEHEIELLKVAEPETPLLDVSVDSSDLYMRVEPMRRIAGDERFRLFDVLLLEEELAVQIREVDCVQVDLRSARERDGGIARLLSMQERQVLFPASGSHHSRFRCCRIRPGQGS